MNSFYIIDLHNRLSKPFFNMIWNNSVSFSLIFSPSISKYKILYIIHFFLLLHTTIPQFLAAISLNNHKEFGNRIHPKNQKNPLKRGKLHQHFKGFPNSTQIFPAGTRTTSCSHCNPPDSQ